MRRGWKYTWTTVKKTNFSFAFQIGHKEIGKVSKFGVVWRPFWGFIADLRHEGCWTPTPTSNRVNIFLLSNHCFIFLRRIYSKCRKNCTYRFNDIYLIWLLFNYFFFYKEKTFNLRILLNANTFFIQASVKRETQVINSIIE